MINGIEEIDLKLRRANIPLFGGNMVDFREKHPDEEYTIAGDFFTNPIPHLVSNLPQYTERELLEKGFDGMINTTFRRFLLLFGYYTGVPIKRIRNGNGAGFSKHAEPLDEFQL